MTEQPVDQITIGEVYRVLGRVEKSLDEKVPLVVYDAHREQIHEDIALLRGDMRRLQVEVQRFAIKVAAIAATVNTLVIAAGWLLVQRKSI